MKKIYLAIISVFAVSMMATAFAAPSAGAATNLFKGCDGVSDNSGVCAEKNKGAKGITNSAKKGINAAITVLAIICVLMVVLAGFLYTISSGDASRIQTAKNTLMYAIIGLVVAILSFAIVNFVIKKI